MLPRRVFFWACLLMACGALLGCQGGENRARVTGTVTYRNAPVPNALVVFMPETPDKLPASGLTDANGRYELMTLVKGDGASLGKHRVTITARAAEKKAEPGIIAPPSDTPAALIPEHYFQPGTSGLTAEVVAGGITANFTLKEK